MSVATLVASLYAITFILLVTPNIECENSSPSSSDQKLNNFGQVEVFSPSKHKSHMDIKVIRTNIRHLPKTSASPTTPTTSTVGTSTSPSIHSPSSEFELDIDSNKASPSLSTETSYKESMVPFIPTGTQNIQEFSTMNLPSFIPVEVPQELTTFILNNGESVKTPNVSVNASEDPSTFENPTAFSLTTSLYYATLLQAKEAPNAISGVPTELTPATEPNVTFVNEISTKESQTYFTTLQNKATSHLYYQLEETITEDFQKGESGPGSFPQRDGIKNTLYQSDEELTRVNLTTIPMETTRSPSILTEISVSVSMPEIVASTTQKIWTSVFSTKDTSTLKESIQKKDDDPGGKRTTPRWTVPVAVAAAFGGLALLVGGIIFVYKTWRNLRIRPQTATPDAKSPA